MMMMMKPTTVSSSSSFTSFLFIAFALLCTLVSSSVEATKKDPCILRQGGCFECTSDGDCAYCPSNGACYSKDLPYSCPRSLRSITECCKDYEGCTDCTATGYCSWCESDNTCRSLSSNSKCDNKRDTLEQCCSRYSGSCYDCVKYSDACSWCNADDSCHSQFYHPKCGTNNTGWSTNVDECCIRNKKCGTCTKNDNCVWCRRVNVCHDINTYSCSDFTSKCECPNRCSGNGDCDENTLICDCDYGFSGDDCNSRTYRIQYALAYSFGGFILIIIVIGVIWEAKKKFVNFLDQMRHMKQLQNQKLQPDLDR